MRAEIKQRWIDALRSGEYEQGKDALNVRGRFCCLGVLCDLFVRDGLGEWKTLKETSQSKSLGGHPGYPSVQVMEWAGLPLICGGVQNVMIGDDPITSLNDSGAWSFQQIADLIEREIPSE